MNATRTCIASKALAGALLACWAGSASAGTEGASTTIYGTGAGSVADAAVGENSFFGLAAGASTTTGSENTFIGAGAGTNNTLGTWNTFVGRHAGGNNVSGHENTVVGYFAGTAGTLASGNIFIGSRAGMSETGSNTLYIDTCFMSPACDTPLIYGEFDTRLLAFDGVLHVTANKALATVKSQLHFSVNGADEGGWMTSAGANNFFTSSGARYDADAGGWIQRSADGKAVIAGSGAAGFRVLTSSGTGVGAVAVPVSRLHIDYAGLMGVNAAPVAGRAINTSTGAYLSSGGVWTNASSRDLKENVLELPADRALQAFRELKPVTFNYTNEGAGHVGFIAEDVPDLVATADRKGLSAMDVVAVLTKVVQQQAAELEEMKQRLLRLESR